MLLHAVETPTSKAGNKNLGGLKVGVVIPTLDEEKNIGSVVRRLKALSFHDVLVVDGNSRDRTRQVARDCGARVIVQDGLGKGNALRQVFNNGHVDADVYVLIDADGSMRPVEVDRMLEGIVSGSDLVKGSRFIRGGYTYDMTFVRRFGSAIIVMLFNLIWGTRFTDLCYGFIALTAESVKKLAPLLEANGFEIETEMIIKANKLGLRIKEVPSTEFKRKNGQSKLNSFRDGLQILRTILKERAT